MWRHSETAAEQLGALPMEVLQAAFWSLDPQRTVRKFAQFGRLDPTGDEARRFVELEEWANEGEPLPYPAARELIEDLFGHDLPGSGRWVSGATSSPCPRSTSLPSTTESRPLPPRVPARRSTSLQVMSE